MRVSFREFDVDFDQRRLFAGDREVRIAPKALDLLRLLIDKRPAAIGKSEIFARLWPDTFVTENTLATLIGDLRSALGDDASAPVIIRTAYGFGYAFVAEIAKQPPAVTPETVTQWMLVSGPREIPLPTGVTILGRSGPGVITLDSSTVSREHARLTVTSEQLVIDDLGSKNGTWVGQVPVSGPTPLKDGDEIRLGSFVVAVCAVAPGSSTETLEAKVSPKTG
jgi:DNA-binding winged helix-turn-helix (wHTH) protein